MPPFSTGVSRQANDHFHTQLLELGDTVIVGDDFRWANESEIQRIEEQHHIFAAQVGQLEGFIDRAIGHHGGGGEIGGGLGDENAHGQYLLGEWVIGDTA